MTRTPVLSWCPAPCDHCRPTEWHDCVLERGHDGHHTCKATS